ncbi:hypothetical protein K1I42_10560 [Hydrogenophilus thermoluteolus]|nr:hypothetical protein [Hydrogenophilus thermoluteolus]MBW7657725.1 hypothetical protein [Hydrogenophilus thermoluteolus]
MATVLPLPATTDVQIVRVVKALYDAAPGNTYLTAFREFANNNGGVAAVANAILPTSDKTALADLIVANLKLTGDAATNGKAYLLAQFNAPGANIGQVIVDAMNALAGLGNDPTFGAAANAFNASIAQAYAYSINTSNTTTDLATLQAADEVQVDENGNPVPQGQTFTLTNGIDAGAKFTGTSSDDVFSGALNAQGAVTFQAFDQLDGGAGKDILIAQSIGSLSTNATTLKNIERIEVYGMVANATLGLANTTGVEEILIANSAGNATVSGINTGIKVLEVSGNPTTNTLDTFTFTLTNTAVSGASDAITLKVSGVGDSASNDNVTIQPTSGVNGVETLTIEAEASPSYVTLDDGTSTSLKTLNVKGDVDLTLTVTPATLTAFDASFASGKISANLTTNTQDIDIKGGSGDDSFNLGNNLTKNDKIDGGAGKNTLQFNSAATTLTDTFQVSNIQTLRISDALAGNLDVSKFGSSVNSVRLDSDTNATRTISKLGADATLDLRVAQSAGTIHTLVLANTSGTDDKVTIALNGNYSGAGATVLNYRTVKVDNVENVTIQSNYNTAGNPDNQGDQALLTLDAAQAKKLTITGKVGLNLSGSTITSVTEIDATGLVPEVAPTNATAGDGGLTVTLATGLNQTAVVKTGSGNDVIVSGAGSDNITTGNGVDRVTIGAGNDTVDLGAGDDFLILTANGQLTTDDTIKGGDGVDRIQIEAAMTLSDGAFTNVSGFERIVDNLATTATVSLNLGANAAAAFGNTIRIDQTNAATGATYNVNGAGLSSGQIIDFRGATQALVDTIVGGAGNDVIRGGGDADLLTGGAGADIFRIGAVAESAASVASNTTRTFDKITDYVAGVDKIQLLAGALGGALTLTSDTTFNVATITDSTAATWSAVAGLASVTSVAASTAVTVQVRILELSNAAFQQSGNPGVYLWINNDTAGLDEGDIMIDITGVTGTISGSDFGLFTV